MASADGLCTAAGVATQTPDITFALLDALPCQDLLNASAVSTEWRAIAKGAESFLWARITKDPQVGPYYQPEFGLPGPDAFRRSVQLAKAWHAGKARHDYINFTDMVRATAVDFKNKSIMVGSNAGYVMLATWGMPRIAPTREFRDAHDYPVLGLDFSLDADVCVSSSGEPAYKRMKAVSPSIKVHTISTRMCEHTLWGHDDSINDVKLVDSMAKIAISASTDRTIKTWNLQTGVLVRTLTGHTDAVTCLCMVDGGKHVLSASRDGTVRKWEWATGKCLGTPWRGDVAISAMHFCASTGTLALGDVSGAVRLLRPDHRAAGNSMVCTSEAVHVAAMSEVASLQHDADKIVSVALDGSLKVFCLRGERAELHEGWALRHLNSKVSSVSFAGSDLVVNGFDYRCCVLGFVS
mmetsp:Transcript_19022/g.43193  ORF Transcript_19022/g.43193 Transcript_19022/m.43193 type:complete len:409 (+) Transcript_19022:56-1282(+)